MGFEKISVFVPSAPQRALELCNKADHMENRYIFKSPQKVGLASNQRFAIPASKLKHTFVKNEKISSAIPIADGIFQSSLEDFEGKMGMKFDRYNARHAEIMKPIMWKNKRMPEVFDLLGLDYGNVEKLYLPWWNVEGGMEISCKETPGGVMVGLGSRHTYQTQLMRQGVDIPGMNAVSVAGIVHTSDNKLVVGLRGGLNFPNTYYFNAGALGMTDALKSGSDTIFSTYLRTELKEEYGMSDGGKGAILLSRVQIHGTDRDISYVFVIKTPAKFREIMMIHQSNPSLDRHEHRLLTGIGDTEKAVLEFVNEFYSGVVDNDLNRKYRDRKLLPQGAAPLIDCVGGDISVLERLAQ
jgi:hypothetical protein